MSADRSHPLPWTSVLLALLVVAATALGGLRAAALAQHRPGPRTLEVAGVSYTVTGVELVPGLSDHDLGGMAHGVQGLVQTEQAMVNVQLTVSARGKAAHYDPGVLRAASSPTGDGAAPAGGSIAPGRLSAHGSVEGWLSYVVPRDGADLVLRAGHGRRAIALLRVDRTTAHHDADHADHADTTHSDHSEPAGTPATGSPS